jgi:hypothetical protein
MARVVPVTAVLGDFLEEGSPAQVFAVGSYINDVNPISVTADLHKVEDRPIAKRGECRASLRNSSYLL